MAKVVVAHTLQEKMKPVLERLVADGEIESFEEERDLGRVCGGVPYRADYFIKMPNGKALVVEVDNPRHHVKSKDDARDEALVLAGISTVRVSAAEISSGEADGKVREAVKAVRSGKVIVAGSTRVRKVATRSRRDFRYPDMGVYLYIWHHGDAWGWALSAHEQRFRKSARAWIPSEAPEASATGKLYVEGLSREDVAAVALSDEGFWAELPERCNLRMYGMNVDVAGSAELSSGVSDRLAAHNVVSSQRVSQRQCRAEGGAQSNFGMLADLESEARALAETALLEGDGAADVA